MVEERIFTPTMVHISHRLDSMAVSASDFTLGYLFQYSIKAHLRQHGANTPRFQVWVDMVKVQRLGVSVVPTINAASFHLDVCD